MANIKSAKKRIGLTLKQQARNRSARSSLRTAMKKIRSEVAAGNREAAKRMLPSTLSLIDSTAQKKIIHRNAAARTKSRLTRAVHSL